MCLPVCMATSVVHISSVSDKGFPLIRPLWKWEVNPCSFDSWSHAQVLSERLGITLSILLVGATLNWQMLF